VAAIRKDEERRGEEDRGALRGRQNGRGSLADDLQGFLVAETEKLVDDGLRLALPPAQFHLPGSRVIRASKKKSF
jgi:hypothetical protein